MVVMALLAMEEKAPVSAFFMASGLSLFFWSSCR